MPKLTYHLIKKGLLQGDDVGLGRNKCWLQRVKNGYQGVFLKILITRWRNTLNGFWILSYMSSNKTFLDHLISNFDFFWWTFDGRNDFIPPPPSPSILGSRLFSPSFFFSFFFWQQYNNGNNKYASVGGKGSRIWILSTEKKRSYLGSEG